jgi:nucleoid DNA-binding protein
MTKADLVKAVSSETGYARKDVAVIVDTFLSMVKEKMKEGNHIEIRQFGTYKLKVRSSRVGRNPKTNETVQVAARVIPTFKFSREFKQEVLATLKPENIEKK